jgi:hypothetical protein
MQNIFDVIKLNDFIGITRERFSLKINFDNDPDLRAILGKDLYGKLTFESKTLALLHQGDTRKFNVFMEKECNATKLEVSIAHQARPTFVGWDTKEDAQKAAEKLTEHFYNKRLPELIMNKVAN